MGRSSDKIRGDAFRGELLISKKNYDRVVVSTVPEVAEVSTISLLHDIERIVSSSEFTLLPYSLSFLPDPFR